MTCMFVDYPQDCPPQNCPLGGNPEVGNSESISHQDCPPQLLCFFMNCLCSIWALGECWELRRCIQSQYFEEKGNSCDYRIHLKTHSGEKSKKCAQWDIAGHLRTCLKTHSEKKTNANSVILYLIRQEIWGDIWKHTVEKSQANATNATLLSLWQVIWRDIWKHTVEKSQINVTSVTMHPIMHKVWKFIWLNIVEKSQTNAASVTMHPHRQVN